MASYFMLRNKINRKGKKIKEMWLEEKFKKT